MICQRNCPNRTENCHAKCEAYLAEYAENRKRNCEKLKKAVIDFYKADLQKKYERDERRKLK